MERPAHLDTQHIFDLLPSFCGFSKMFVNISFFFLKKAKNMEKKMPCAKQSMILRWMQTSCNLGPAAPGRKYFLHFEAQLGRSQCFFFSLFFNFSFFSEAQPARAKLVFLISTGCGRRCESKLVVAQFT